MNLTGYIRQRLKDRRLLLMTHLIVGYPSLDANRRMLEIMGEVGVDLVELQMPFSEPIADGALFARACQESLEAHTTLAHYFDLLSESAARHDFPHLMMGYYNVVLQCGEAPFSERLAAAGAAGLIIPDLPIEEYAGLHAACRQHGLSGIQLMAPTCSPQRLQTIGSHAEGFVYAVARKGVTGRESELGQGVLDFLSTCREYTDLPLGVGFGLRRAEHVRQLHGYVEIGIVGSALLIAWESGGEDAYRELLESLADARYS